MSLSVKLAVKMTDFAEALANSAENILQDTTDKAYKNVELNHRDAMNRALAMRQRAETLELQAQAYRKADEQKLYKALSKRPDLIKLRAL